MACWINVSPLCVSLTRQSSGFMADWICVIKDDKQNHLLVTSICHRPAFAISRTSLKNNSKSLKEREKERKGGGTGDIRCNASERKRGEGELKRPGDARMSRRVWAKVNEEARVRRQSAGVMERRLNTARRRRKEQMEMFYPSLSQPVGAALLCPQIVL